MITKLDTDTLTKLVASEGVAIRVRQRLQPAGGAGDKIFPPTYATGDNKLKYAEETRRVEGQDIRCFLLDSVASQANRMEEALQAAWDEEELNFPVIGVDFAGDTELADIGAITTLQAPHRIADAILRDSTDLDGTTLFRDLPEGQAFTNASAKNATAVYNLCPTALIFGVWDSTGPKGGLGAKFQRAITSEIVAVNAKEGSKVGSRIDPLAVQANVTVYAHKDDPSDWTIDVEEALLEKKKPVEFSRKGGDGKGKPSAINHSNIAPTIDTYAGGITFDYAVQTVVLSLPALRNLSFKTDLAGKPLANRKEAALAARTSLAALAIASVVHQRAKGYDLRSRCLLIPDGAFELEVIANDGSTSTVALSIEEANALVAECAKRAEAAGMGWKRQPLKLRPAPKLVDLVKKSRAQAAAGVLEE